MRLLVRPSLLCADPAAFCLFRPQVGGASLKPEFVDIIKAAEKSK